MQCIFVKAFIKSIIFYCRKRKELENFRCASPFELDQVDCIERQENRFVAIIARYSLKTRLMNTRNENKIKIFCYRISRHRLISFLFSVAIQFCTVQFWISSFLSFSFQLHSASESRGVHEMTANFFLSLAYKLLRLENDYFPDLFSFFFSSLSLRFDFFFFTSSSSSGVPSTVLLFAFDFAVQMTWSWLCVRREKRLLNGKKLCVCVCKILSGEWCCTFERTWNEHTHTHTQMRKEKSAKEERRKTTRAKTQFFFLGDSKFCQTRQKKSTKLWWKMIFVFRPKVFIRTPNSMLNSAHAIGHVAAKTMLSKGLAMIQR